MCDQVKFNDMPLLDDDDDVMNEILQDLKLEKVIIQPSGMDAIIQELEELEKRCMKKNSKDAKREIRNKMHAEYVREKRRLKQKENRRLLREYKKQLKSENEHRNVKANVSNADGKVVQIEEKLDKCKKSMEKVNQKMRNYEQNRLRIVRDRIEIS